MLVLVFNRIIELSLTGSIIALLILGTKWLFKDKVSPKWHYYIWFVLLVKLVMPVDIESTYAIIPSVEFQSQGGQTLPMMSESPVLYSKLFSDIHTGMSEIEIESQLLEWKYGAVLPMLSKVWLIIVLLMVFYKALRERQFYMKQMALQEICNPMINNLKDRLMKDMGLNKRIGIYIHNGKTVPKVYGVIKPKIIISEELLCRSDISRLKYVLLHELYHVKQKDVIINALRSVLMCIYFFNPLIVWCLGKMAVDCETSCDAMLLEGLDPQERLDYGHTLISLIKQSSQKTQTLALSLGRKKDMVRRIEMIKSYRSVNLKSKIVGLVLTVVLVGSCLIVPHASAEEVKEIGSDDVVAIQPVDVVTMENEEEIQSELSFIKPVENGNITSYYGSRFEKVHSGVDIGAQRDEAILAAESGKVVYVDLENTELGKIIVLEHLGGIKTLYAQCEEILVEVDDFVEKGDSIATVGMSGRSTGPHLHLELLIDNEPVDPKTMMEWIE